MRTQGQGAQSTQPVGASCQLGKEQTLPYAEDLFSRHGVGLGQPHSMSLIRACSDDAELPGVFSEQALKHFQRLLGHMASAAAVTPLGLLHMRYSGYGKSIHSLLYCSHLLKSFKFIFVPH